MKECWQNVSINILDENSVDIGVNPPVKELCIDELHVKTVEVADVSMKEKNTPTSKDRGMELTFRCLECDFRAVDKVQMEEHRKSYHLDTETETSLSYMCIDCGKVFAEDENYQIHMETHVKPVDKKEVDGAKEIVTEQVVADQPFVSAMPVGHICTICSFLAEDSTDLNDHTLKYHLQGINCPECDYIDVTLRKQLNIAELKGTISNVSCVDLQL